MTAAADSLTERARVATDTWLREFVIALDLCPFASPALLRGEVGIEVCPATALEAALGAIAQGTERVLDDESGPRTLLLVLPSGFTDLDDFLEGVEKFDVGSQNWAYADVDGNLAYFTSAELPLRKDLEQGFVDGLPPYLIRDGSGPNNWVANPAPGPDQTMMDFESSPTWPGLVHEFRQGKEIHLPDHSHFIPMEAPELVARHVLEV